MALILEGARDLIRLLLGVGDLSWIWSWWGGYARKDTGPQLVSMAWISTWITSTASLRSVMGMSRLLAMVV
jgi:hypothetical protein